MAEGIDTFGDYNVMASQHWLAKMWISFGGLCFFSVMFYYCFCISTANKLRHRSGIRTGVKWKDK